MFLNIIMLAGLGGAVVPLVLHLLSRSRYRSLDWGAMMFLPDSDVRQKQAARLKQWILLLLRMAIVAALAVALARPIVRGRWVALTQGSRVTAVIILDRSASMGFESNGRSRMEQATETVLQILSHLRKGDRVALLLAGDSQKEMDVPTADLQEIAARLTTLKPTAGQADIASCLIRAADVFDRYEKFNRELYVICDRQSSNWRDVNESFRNVWRHRVAESAIPLRFFMLPVGGQETENVAVESVELLNPPAIAGHAVEVEIRVRNYGQTPRVALPLVLRAGNREVLNTTVNVIPAGGVASVRASATFNEAGSHVLSAVVKSAGQVADDRRDCALDVIEPIRVLVVSGDKGAGPYRGAADFLKLAMAPYQAVKRRGPDVASVKVIEAEHLGEADLGQCAVVVLANVPQVSLPQVRALEQYVWGGGGLLVAPGNLCRAEIYNAALYRDGAGILPAMLNAPTAGDGSAATSLLGFELSHPVFRFLKGKPDPIPSATVGRYFPATARQPDARVISSYVSGQPFLIEGAWGHGRVLLVTTPLDTDWNTLPLSSFYLPFVQSAVRYLAAAEVADRNLEPGQPIDAVLESVPPDQKVSLELPDGRSETLEVLRVGPRGEVHFAQTDQPGQYHLRYKTEKETRSAYYIVRPPRDESDPTPLSPEQLQNLQQMLGFELVEPGEKSVASMFAASRIGRELWPALLALVMALSVVELALARRWSVDEA